jgi:hypothetical protein
VNSRQILATLSCNGPMRIIALIDDPAVVRRILKHMGCWAPEASMSEFATRAKAASARSIRKMYKRDAIDCPVLADSGN